MYEVSVSGWFAAAHQLRLPDGAVEPLHGHNWRVVATFAGADLDRMEVLVDFTQARARLDEVLKTLHDSNLNELPGFADCNPSTERVACHIADRLVGDLPAGVRLRSVEVEESPGCVARYYSPEPTA
jgi:6-pyruvoyltetrahydropterin/6-carboxytetrahydropterin synthase